MLIVKHETYNDMSRAVANMIAREIRNNPHTVLCLATGSTPIGIYQELVRLHREEDLDFSQVTTFNLDEYYGLDKNDPQSYSYFMREHLFAHVNVSEQNIHHIRVPSNNLEDVARYCQEYELKIKQAGGFDILIDGIGLNGHIGFNEPADELQSYTHLVDLTQSTIEANSRFFSSMDEVPRHALTMGMATILGAKKILLVASGKHKAEIVNTIMDATITTQIPATLLHLHHDTEMHVDSKAAQLVDQKRSAERS
ncbi:glucosamine-6-phosphate deaminase [Lederbergia sp. NSJ-179]|uniref:glucosamine-6-phosphate deaminase n=1 Tax=Lederbergia sp. NSJ-179 TaxID=2931402 RepID=UPI001FD4BA00|nr:glucosamine-6-phosphate deaminase [Lederbergia sp. NSJ-179]MCJ7843114.1 glucosamine-6-phosphate deaminase [Lederbergia sp. NSJ-179]